MSENISELEKRYFSGRHFQNIYIGRYVMGWPDVESFKSFLNCMQFYDG